MPIQKYKRWRLNDSTAHGWAQPGGFSWRACAVGDPASDACDPSGDPTRDNALAFLTVFAVQCCAIALGHVVLMWKLRRMVTKDQQSRRRAMADPRLEQRARRFVAHAKAREERERSKGGGGGPGRKSHSDTTLYISLGIIHTKYIGWRQNDFNVYA